jgi:hypothetical protein
MRAVFLSLCPTVEQAHCSMQVVKQFQYGARLPSRHVVDLRHDPQANILHNWTRVKIVTVAAQRKRHIIFERRLKDDPTTLECLS